MKKRILFLDDEPNMLQSLRRSLRPMRHEWEMVFTESAQGALALMAQASFDVVVSDMKMPGMGGARFLAEVMERYPQTTRIALSGHTDQEMALQSVRSAHQYLAKPCNPQTIKATVARACALQTLWLDTSLQRLVSGMKTLPSLPSLYFKVIEAMETPDSSLEKVGKIIASDMGMTAKILQVVNSAFFGLRQQVHSPVQAVMFLGLDTIKALILSVGIFTHFDSIRMKSLSLERLWKHSIEIGGFAKHLVKDMNCDRQMVDKAYIAGLLHDVGKLVFAANLPQPYSEALAMAREQKITDWEAERAVLHATHAEVGAYLLGLWGFSDSIVEALAFHHCPSASPNQAFSPLTAVHIANALAQETDTVKRVALLDSKYVAALDLSARLANWREHHRAFLAGHPLPS